jgi:hypothetical protein
MSVVGFFLTFFSLLMSAILVVFSMFLFVQAVLHRITGVQLFFATGTNTSTGEYLFTVVSALLLSSLCLYVYRSAMTELGDCYSIKVRIVKTIINDRLKSYSKLTRNKNFEDSLIYAATYSKESKRENQAHTANDNQPPVIKQ